MPGIHYYDLRHVTGQVTHIDIDNGVVESAGTSFFNKAVIRVLSGTGWGFSRSIIMTPVVGKNLMKFLSLRAGSPESLRNMSSWVMLPTVCSPCRP